MNVLKPENILPRYPVFLFFFDKRKLLLLGLCIKLIIHRQFLASLIF